MDFDAYVYFHCVTKTMLDFIDVSRRVGKKGVSGRTSLGGWLFNKVFNLYHRYLSISFWVFLVSRLIFIFPYKIIPVIPVIRVFVSGFHKVACSVFPFSVFGSSALSLLWLCVRIFFPGFSRSLPISSSLFYFMPQLFFHFPIYQISAFIIINAAFSFAWVYRVAF